MRVLCSTGALTCSSDPLSHESIARYGPQLAVDGLEVIVYPRWYAALDQVARALRVSGLALPAIHAEKGIGEAFSSDDSGEQEQGVACFECNCFFARETGAGLAVLHLWGLPQSDTHLERNLRLLTCCLDIADRYGLDLAIETIPCTASDPLANVRRAIEHDARTRCARHIVSGYAQPARRCLCSLLALAGSGGQARASERLRRALTRECGEALLHPGDGEIDFGRFVRQLRAAGFAGTLSLEARGIDSKGQVEVARINASLRLIVDLARAS